MPITAVRKVPLGRRLRVARKTCGFSIDAFARELEIEPGAYRGYEEGAAEPDLSTLVYVARLSGRSTDWLLTGKGPVEAVDIED